MSNTQLRPMVAAVDILNMIAPVDELAVTLTDDNGIVLEMDHSDRSLLIALSDTGGRYFTARNKGGFRSSGVIQKDAVISDLLAWLHSTRIDFPELVG